MKSRQSLLEEKCDRLENEISVLRTKNEQEKTKNEQQNATITRILEGDTTH